MAYHKQDGKTFDLSKFVVNDITYRVQNNVLKVQHLNGRYYNISTAPGQNIIRTATAGNPDILLFKRKPLYKARRTIYNLLAQKRKLDIRDRVLRTKINRIKAKRVDFPFVDK